MLCFDRFYRLILLDCQPHSLVLIPRAILYEYDHLCPYPSSPRAVVERILNHALDPALVKLYGPALAASVQGARAGFVRVACAEPDLFVDTDPVGAQARVPGADEAPPPGKNGSFLLCFKKA